MKIIYIDPHRSSHGVWGFFYRKGKALGTIAGDVPHARIFELFGTEGKLESWDDGDVPLPIIKLHFTLKVY